MTKTDHPVPFRMTIQNGRLVPAQAWDEERLATYRNGSSVSVIITQEKNRKLERKYWAILHRVVKSCPVRQRTAEDLHKAIRLKLGIVDSFTTLGGAIKVELRSTSGMEDPEYSAFFEEAMELLSAETGVDVQTLHAESADVGDDEPGSTEPSSPSVETAGSEPEHDVPLSSDVASTPAGEPEGAGAETQEQSERAPAPEDQPSVSPSVRMLMEECIDNMLREAMSAPSDQAAAKVAKMRDIWAMPENLGEHVAFVDRCAETARRVIGQPADREKAKAYLLSKVPA